MSSPSQKHEAPLPEGAEAPARLSPSLRIALWQLQFLAEVLELAIAAARTEAALPENLGDRETNEELERAQFALFLLGNYILRRVGPSGGAA